MEKRFILYALVLLMLSCTGKRYSHLTKRVNFSSKHVGNRSVQSQTRNHNPKRSIPNLEQIGLEFVDSAEIDKADLANRNPISYLQRISELAEQVTDAESDVPRTMDVLNMSRSQRIARKLIPPEKQQDEKTWAIIFVIAVVALSVFGIAYGMGEPGCALGLLLVILLMIGLILLVNN